MIKSEFTEENFVAGKPTANQNADKKSYNQSERRTVASHQWNKIVGPMNLLNFQHMKFIRLIYSSDISVLI